MPGLLLQGGIHSAMGQSSNAAVPPLMQAPAAPTTATSAGGIAFGADAGASVSQRGGSIGALFSLEGGAVRVWVGMGSLAMLLLVYKSLPK